METEEQIKFMREAIRISVENVSSVNGGPFGAVIVQDGVIIASGANKVTRINDPTAHAEMIAIRAACKKLKSYQLQGCEIYCSCEPCPMCIGAIYWARLDKIYFANTKKDAAEINFDDDFIYAELDLSREHRKIPTIQILRDEAQVAFTKWRDSSDKTEY